MTHTPSEWAIKRAIEETGGRAKPWEIPSDETRQAVEAFARYIERTEKPPVDPDVLSLRVILAEYVDNSSEDISLRSGMKDETTGFQQALKQFRHALAMRVPIPQTADHDRQQAHKRAVMLFEALLAKHYPQSQTGAAPDLLTVLDQIDNLTTGLKRSKFEQPDQYIENVYQAALQTLGKLCQAMPGRAPLPPASTVAVALQQIEILVSEITAPKQPISHEQLTKLNGRLLSAYVGVNAASNHKRELRAILEERNR